MSFTIPLNNEHSRKRRELAAERDRLLFRRDAATDEVTGQIRLLLLDMNRYNRLLQGEISRLSELEDYLSVRGEAYRNRIGEYNRLSRTKEYNTYLLCWENLLHYQYRRDMCLSRLQAFLTDHPIQEFCNITFVEY